MSGRTPLHVVAAVLHDAQGRLLLARRPEGKADAGLWEFPGGKVEPGESPREALGRELQEELGVRMLDAEPLIRVPVAAAGEGAAIRLRLDTWRVTAFEGDPVAHEHAALAWVAPEALATYPMPPPDRPVVAALREPGAILITPEPGDGPEAEAAWWRGIDLALSSGLPRLHLRLPDARAAQRVRLAEALAQRCRAAGARLYVHGEPDLAHRLGVGLHWRSGQLRHPAAVAASAAQRRAGLPLSAAVHDADEIARAEALGVDDLVLGPVKPTATHPGHPGLGWAAFEALRALTSLPVHALGGLGPDDFAAARQHGAQGVAGIRAMWPGG